MKPLRILLVEDSERDAARVSLELRRAGYDAEITRVDTLPRFREELGRGGYDLVVSDYCLPSFSAPEALALFREQNIDVPFIVVSGAVGEDIAVEVMKSGAHDYVLKDRMMRLVPAIERELGEVKERGERRRAETLFQSILRSSPHPSAVVRRDGGGIVHISDSFRRTLMNDQTLVPGQRLLDVVEFAHPERVAQVLLRGGSAPYVVYTTSDGENRVANVRVHTVEHQGTAYANVVIEDVTEQHYLKTAFDAVGDAVIIVSSSQTLLYANRAAEGLWEPLYFGMDVQPMLAAFGLAVPHSEPRLSIHGGTYEVRAVPFRFAGEDESSTILTFRNVSQEEELIALSTHDPLTGIYNVRFFDEALRGGDGGALVLVDLDRFKPINDDLGHSAGDAALIRFTHLIRRELRPGDVFARLGGDEFGILFPHTSVDEATAIVSRIFATLERNPFHYDGQSRTLSASCGIGAVVPPAEETKKRVDAALYEAKRTGRGRWVVA
jgi:diguanylate cyclase (GGDEF)-like protein